MNKELELIKLKYGEAMMHYCRANFPTILETEGRLFTILSKRFDFSKNLFNDIVSQGKEREFKNFIYYYAGNRKNIGNNNDNTKADLENERASAKELLDKAGYILYECKTEEEIQSFKRFYAKDEELCTFKGNRLDSCYVFFAVKKNVDEIKREDYEIPDRQDAYGTSVISIQFEKDKCSEVSIKNRYNHKVDNPDATFSNNLDNIISGLTEAFNRDYLLNLNNSNSLEKPNFQLPNYVQADDGKYYKYNYMVDNVYYCPNNIIIDNLDVKKYDKDRYLIFDNYILDTREKNIDLYDYNLSDGFIDTNGNIEKVEVKKEKSIKKIIINDHIEIGLDNENNITYYRNSKLKEIPDNFLIYNIKMQVLDTPNVESIGNFCFCFNKHMQVLNAPNLKTVGSMVLLENNNIDLTRFNLDKDSYERVVSERMMFNEGKEEYDQSQSTRSK